MARCGARPPRTVTVAFSPFPNPDFCMTDIHLRGFVSNTTYTVDITAAFDEGPETVSESVTTDGCGSAVFSSFVLGKEASVRAEVEGVSSGELVQVACSA